MRAMKPAYSGKRHYSRLPIGAHALFRVMARRVRVFERSPVAPTADGESYRPLSNEERGAIWAARYRGPRS
jgi:hypothetical protein